MFSFVFKFQTISFESSHLYLMPVMHSRKIDMSPSFLLRFSNSNSENKHFEFILVFHYIFDYTFRLYFNHHLDFDNILIISFRVYFNHHLAFDDILIII